MEYRDLKFLKWYTRALSGVIGLYICLYGYLSGEIIIYQNLSKYIGKISSYSLIASYALLPLCILMIAVSLLQALNIFSRYVAWIFSLTTLIVGFVGCKEYFLIAGIVIIFNIIFESKNFITSEQTIEMNTVYEDNPSQKHLNIDSVDIVLDLLENKADKNFIMDITGLSIEDIEYIEKNK